MVQLSSHHVNIQLQHWDDLITHKADNGRVIIIEYEVQENVVATVTKYNNRFCSVIKVEGRKIVYRRDHMHSLATWNALTARSG